MSVFSVCVFVHPPLNSARLFVEMRDFKVHCFASLKIE